MTVSEFCKFFEFTPYKESYTDEYGDVYKYHAVDDQGVFHDRVANKVADFTDEFDSMLVDYIDLTLEDYGFEYDGNGESYYTQALEWIEKSKNDLFDTDTHHVIEALVDPSTLVDDL